MAGVLIGIMLTRLVDALGWRLERSSKRRGKRAKYGPYDKELERRATDEEKGMLG
jgi:hypothetical protein